MLNFEPHVRSPSNARKRDRPTSDRRWEINDPGVEVLPIAVALAR